MKKNEVNVTVRITGMIVSGVLGCLALIGIFWGKDGLIGVGIGILVLTLLVVTVLAMVTGPGLMD